MVHKFLDKHSDSFYFVFRVIVGIVFLLHGIMKVKFWMAGQLPVGSLMFFAMIIEVIGGVLIILGLFTRYTACVAAIEMIVAYTTVHLASGKGINPLANGGEAAVLFFAIFLVLAAFGARKWAIDKK